MFKLISKKSLCTLAATLVIASFGPSQLFAETQVNKIVSIGGSVTEIIYALGQEDRLIARDTTSLFPIEAQQLPDVGYIRRLSPEGVLSINPELIITLEGAGPPEAVDVIKSSNIPIVQIPESYDEEGVISKILSVGRALSKTDEAVQLANKVRADFVKAQGIINSIQKLKKVMFVLSANGGKILAAGRNTSADGMIKMAGAENALANMEGYKPVTDEAIVNAAPEVIIMMQRHGTDLTASNDVLAYPAIAATPAGREKLIIKMDGLYLLGYGPRTGKAVLELSDSIYKKPSNGG